jgi:hypothetical protein
VFCPTLTNTNQTSHASSAHDFTCFLAHAIMLALVYALVVCMGL